MVPARRRSRPPLRSRSGRDQRWSLALLALFAVAAAWRVAYVLRLPENLNADARIYWDWSEWILRHGPSPPTPFFLAPLYPYALAAMRVVTGGSVSGVLIAQALLGGAAVVVLSGAAARVAGRASALAVGLVLALGRPETFFDGLVLPESLLFFLESALVALVVRTDWTSAPVGRFAAYGVLVGVLAQGRASHALLLAPMAVLVRGRRSAAAAIAAFAVCCLPAALANLRSSNEMIPFTYNLGFNLYVGFNPEADGTYTEVTGGSLPVPLEGTSPVTGGALDGRAYLRATEGVELSPAESSARWARKAAAHVRSAPLDAIRLAGRKALLAWSHRSSPQIESMAAMEGVAGPLGLPVAGSFGFLALLGLTGSYWAARRGPAERWLVGYVAVMTLSMTPFFVTDRYRHHLMPALAVLAGLAMVEIARRRARALPVVACAAAIVLVPVGARDARLGRWANAADEGMRLLDQGRYPAARVELARAEALLPAVATSTTERTAIAAFQLRHGIALATLGLHEDAIRRWERAIESNTNDAASLARLDLAYEGVGRPEERARVRERLGSVPGGRGLLLLNDGWRAAGRGDTAAAERAFLEALRASPGLSMGWEGLIRLRIQSGRYAEAAKTLDEARGAGLDPAPAEIYACFLAVERGELDRARRLGERIRSAPRDPVLGRLLADVRATLGQAD